MSYPLAILGPGDLMPVWGSIFLFGACCALFGTKRMLLEGMASVTVLMVVAMLALALLP